MLKMLNEPFYEYLQQIISVIEEVSNLSETAAFKDKLEDVVPLDEIDNTFDNLVIFDDFINEKNQSVIEDYFTMGRKRNCSVIYISHDYFGTPERVRLNCNYICLFGFRDKGELSKFKRVFPINISNEKFDNIYKKISKTKHGFLTIDKETSDSKLYYRINLDGILRNE